MVRTVIAARNGEEWILFSRADGELSTVPTKCADLRTGEDTHACCSPNTKSIRNDPWLPQEGIPGKGRFASGRNVSRILHDSNRTLRGNGRLIFMRHGKHLLFRLMLLVIPLFLAACAAKVPPSATPESDAARRGPTIQAEPKRLPHSAPLFSTGEAIVQTAMSQVGRPYARGGTTPVTGFDCSGLVIWVYGRHGVQLPRTAREQSRVGKRVSVGRHQPGDLFFFRTRGRTTNHVGIATGNGTFIHSPRPGDRVREESLQQPYWQQRLVGVRRVI